MPRAKKALPATKATSSPTAKRPYRRNAVKAAKANGPRALSWGDVVDTAERAGLQPDAAILAMTTGLGIAVLGRAVLERRVRVDKP